MVGIVVCCGDVGVVVCRGDVVMVWSLWFVMVMWQTCGGIVIVSKLLWDKGGGVLTMIRSMETTNNDIVVW